MPGKAFQSRPGLVPGPYVIKVTRAIRVTKVTGVIRVSRVTSVTRIIMVTLGSFENRGSVKICEGFLQMTVKQNKILIPSFCLLLTLCVFVEANGS